MLIYALYVYVTLLYIKNMEGKMKLNQHNVNRGNEVK